MKPIIQVESLGKQYAIGALEDRYETLREAIMRVVRAPLAQLRKPKPEMIWALQDVSFQAVPGDVIGVIGRNGAGKSTLLKILSRITEPTTGRVDLYGRVGSLLEVGTGFHPELTGRENVYLNGAILGMKRTEIDAKFDDIVAFAEVERFIDTPVKRYSSGMYLRLAFAVAAFLESEILLVDEVLAVGDAKFQKKCLGKMRDVSSSGRTVLFVSHNMAAVESLCNRCLYISGGRLEGLGTPHDLIGRYLSADAAPKESSNDLVLHPGRPAGYQPIMRSVSLRGDDGMPTSTIRMGSSLSLRVEYCSPQPLRPVLGLIVKNNHGSPVFGINNRMVRGYQFEDAASEGIITCRLANLPLMPDTYCVDLFFGDLYDDYDVLYDAFSFEVISADVFGNGQLPGAECGPIFWPATWTLEPVEIAFVSSRPR
ncbi:MAG TPA: ABC transporter ATP-binding protein [Terriglobales bacterium]|nr:ABC transporter ATP-binding protein [Terriglobales bacterium]